jgi:hypothetical protein
MLHSDRTDFEIQASPHQAQPIYSERFNVLRQKVTALTSPQSSG